MNNDIRETILQWRAKALSDWTTVEILLESEQCPADTVCFHCQQYIEKLLKAVLTRYSIEAPKTHDLRRLIQLAEPYAQELSQFADKSDILTAHGVETRYPGDYREISNNEMSEAVSFARKLGDVLLVELSNE